MTIIKYAVGIIVIGWLGLAIIFGIERGLLCLPAPGSTCGRYNWDRLGDAVLLKWFYDWQTFTAGLIAIGAAFIGGRYINAQMQHAEELERQALARRHAAARAAMPMTLSALTDYAEGTASALRKLLEQAVQGAIPGTANLPQFPQLPADVLGALKDMIETSEVGKGWPYADILAELQVQSARVRVIPADLRDPHHVTTVANVEEYILDAATIYAKSNALFPYARGQVDNVEGRVTWANVRGALSLMDFMQEDFPAMYATTVNREPNLP